MLTDGLSGTLNVHDLELRDRVQARAVIEAVAASEGRLDVLVNNAGYGVIGGIEQVDIDLVRENFETNFFATMALIQEVLPVMRRQRGGHIINVSTVFDAGLAPPAVRVLRRVKGGARRGGAGERGEVRRHRRGRRASRRNRRGRRHRRDRDTHAAGS